MKGAYFADAATSAHAVFIGVAKNRRNAVITIFSNPIFVALGNRPNDSYMRLTQPTLAGLSGHSTKARSLSMKWANTSRTCAVETDFFQCRTIGDRMTARAHQGFIYAKT